MKLDSSQGGVKAVFLFSLPIIISQACDSLMLFTDRALLAQVDAISPLASMSGGMTAFLMWVFGAGMLGFITALVGQYIGAGQPENARQVVPQGWILSIVLALPLLLWGTSIGEYYFRFLRLPPDEHILAMEYLAVILQCCLFVFFKVTFAGFFSGVGRTSLVMGVNIFGLFINVPFTYFMIHGAAGPNWSGVRGAALGTVLAEIAMTSIYFAVFLKNYGKGLKLSFKWELCRKIIRFGAPTGVEFFVLTLAFNTFLMMFHSYGIGAAQAITVATNWSWLTILPFFGLNVGVMSLVGNAMGEGSPALAAKITRSAMIIAFGIVTIATFVFLGFTESLMAVFKVPPTNDLLAMMIRLLPLYCVFDAINFVLSATLRAAGDAKYCLRVSLIFQWSCLGYCYYGVYYGGFAPITIWILFIIALCLQAGFYIYRYRQGAWQQLRVLS